jgi:surfeit locus 1 family protein
VTFVHGTARSYIAIAGLFGLGALFASLGVWQLERADENRALLERFATGAVAVPLTTPPLELSEGARFRRLEVRGEFEAEPQFLLDNMLHEGISGYYVLTALRIPGLRERLLVNRGWVGTGGDRAVLPDVPAAPGLHRVAGRLERLPRPGLRLGEQTRPDGTARGAVVLQFPTAEELETLLGEPVFDYQLLLDPGEPDGYMREWRAPGMLPERNIAYAGQWLALAIGSVVAAGVMVVRISRRRP